MTLVQRLLILVVAILAILVSAGIYGIALFRDAREASVKRELAQTLSSVSAGYGRFLEQTRDSLLIASLEAPRAVADAGVCRTLVGSLHVPDFSWLRFNILDARGIVRCSSEPNNMGADQSDYPEVVAARTGGHAVSADFAWGLFSGAPGLAIATLWHGPDGTSGIITGVAQLDPFLRTLQPLLPQGYAAVLADRGGRILATNPVATDVVGRALPPTLAPLALLTGSGQTIARWTDDTERLVAYAPAAGRLQGVFIAVGVRRAEVMADALALAYPAGVAPLAAAVAAFLLAWWGGVHFIRRPLANLAEVALRWRDGDQSARVALPGRSEIAQLGRVFNAMADAKDQSDRLTREGAELLSALIESSRDCIFVTDRDGRLLLANSTFLEVLGLTREPALGQRPIAQRDRDAQAVMDVLRDRVVASRVPQAADISVQTLDERRRRVLQTICTPIFGTAGEVRAIAGIGRDVTDAREAAETLRAARDRAEAADRAKTRFLAAASHDLRQPLQAAILLADLLSQRAAYSDAPAGRSVDGLRRALDDMKRLVDSLFDVSRLDFGAVQPEITAFPLQMLLDQITIGYRKLAETKGVALVVTPTDAIVRSDRVLLARMLSNLIENAVRYTSKGQVMIACQCAGSHLRIRIEDTGVGISKQDLPRIWQEFEQLHNPERDRRQGLGLGLSIVRRLSTLLDHPVEVSSGPSEGSCFVVSVPLQDERLAAPLEPLTTEAPAQDQCERLVVIVDDDPLVLETLSTTLEEYGLNVIAATDCADAVQRLAPAGRTPDLVIADYRLRGGHVGAEVIAAIRDTVASKVPAIILTGELAGQNGEFDQPLRDAERLGAKLFRKPIRSAELMEAIRSMTAAPIA